MCFDCRNMKPGNELPAELKREALAKYCHRYTADHVPLWVRNGEWKPGVPYPVQFGSDSDWLAHTLFPVSKDGRRLLQGDCHSTPTWPNNPELHRKASAA